jgi:serine palmitoyltransferase
MEDLGRVLEQVKRDMARKPLTRRFIVTEGLFENTGDIVDLPAIIELKQRYKYRLILDESYSFGVLGRTGRGVTEHQNVDPQSVEMLVGSLAHGICSGGGFCAGSPEVVDHQRISSSAYVFSAALPAMLAVTTSETLKLLEGNPQVLTALRENIKAFRNQMDRCEYVECTSSLDNPVCMFILKRDGLEGRIFGNEEKILMDIVDEALANSVMISRVKHIYETQGTKPFGWRCVPSFKACITIGHTKKEVEKAGSVVRQAVGKVMARLKK